MASGPKPHEVLQVSPIASREEIEAAYRSLIKRWHPDRPGGDADQAARVIRAYRKLKGSGRTLPVEVAAPPLPPRSRGRKVAWLLFFAAAAWGAWWLAPQVRWPALVRLPAKAVLQTSSPPSPKPTTELAPPDPASVETGVAEAVRMGSRGEVQKAERYSAMCGEDLERFPGEALLDHCLAFDLAAAAGPLGREKRFAVQAMAERHRTAARSLLPDQVLADAHIAAVGRSVRQTLEQTRLDDEVRDVGPTR